jgi:superfamily II DNA/RNA helicase
MASFGELGISADLCAALDTRGIREPSPVQRLAIPAFLAGKAGAAVARTGSGKTLAYALPLVQRLKTIEGTEGVVATAARPRGIVLTSTRELVEQSAKVLKTLTHAARLRVRSVSGGEVLRDTRRTLGEVADILVANPPRLARLVAEGRVLLDDVRILVVDEADTLLAPGQRDPVESVLTGAPGATIWWASATLPEPIRQYLLARTDKPALLWSKDAHRAPDSVTVRNIPIRPADRADAASNVLISLGAGARGIVFANHRETAALAGEALRERGHDVLVCHGGQLPRERQSTLRRFVAGEGRALVTTELAGRGLDIAGLAFVLNWELPERASDYVHRIGRVGRMGREGRVFNLITDRDRHLLGEVERLAAGGKLDTGEPLRNARTRKTTAQGVREATQRRKKASEKGVVRRFEK